MNWDGNGHAANFTFPQLFTSAFPNNGIQPERKYPNFLNVHQKLGL